jgi:hypothetical protein
VACRNEGYGYAAYHKRFVKFGYMENLGCCTIIPQLHNACCGPGAVYVIIATYGMICMGMGYDGRLGRQLWVEVKIAVLAVQALFVKANKIVEYH